MAGDQETMVNLEVLFWAAVIVVAYAFVQNRLFAVARPLREAALDFASSLMGDARLSAERRREINTLMPFLITRRASWVLALMIPFAFFSVVIRRPDEQEMYGGVPADRRTEWDALNRLMLPAAALNSPAAAFAILAQLMFISYFVRFAALADIAVFRTADSLARGLRAGVSHDPESAAA